MIKCELCGFHYDHLASHLYFKHGMYPVDYQEKFPGAPITSQSFKDTMSEVQLGTYRGPDSEETILRKSEAATRFWNSEEGKKKRKEITEKRMKDPNDGYFGSEVIAQRNREQWSSLSYSQRVGKAISDAKASPEHRKMMSNISRELWKDPEYIEKVKLGRQGIGFGESSSPNLEELTLLCVLDSITLDKWRYNDNGTRVGRKIPDFIHTSKKKVIEYFGIMWHTPGIGEEDRLVNYYKEQGYDCLIVWDQEVPSEDLEERIKTFEQI